MAKRISVVAIGLIVLLAIAAGGFFAGMQYHFHPSAPRLHYPPAATTLEAQRQDIQYFRQLIALDRSFASNDRAEANRRLDALEALDTVLDRPHFRVSLMRIDALADNGHSRVETFVQFKSNTDDGGQSITDFVSSTERRLRQVQPCNVILDLRYDGGGDFVNTYGFARDLPKLVPPAGEIIVLTGPETFSAGISTAAFVKHAGQEPVVIVGEPVGDRLQFFSEGGRACLPNYRLCGAYETGKHDYQHA
jgi:hypothetical protein